MNSNQIENLWNIFEKEISGKTFEKLQRNSLERLGKEGTEGVEKFISSEVLRKIQSETFKAVKADLGDKILLLSSEPSRFKILYLKSLIQLGSEVKRNLASEFQTELEEKFKDHSRKYDVEKDIQRTEEKMQKELEEIRLETLYIEAFDKNRFEEARTFLQAIKLSRVKSSLELKLEAIFWKMNLGIALSETEMFLNAILDSICLREEIEQKKLKEFLKEAIFRLLTLTACKNLHIIPSKFGIQKSGLSESYQRTYFEEQALLFLQGTVSEIVSEILENPEQDISKVSLRILEDRRINFLKANPMIDDIRGSN